ncbi:MAG: hypothetical protein U9Q15_04300 [Patescibacteria group bacterium]|nr:hypothetical protein [Patescibacteria group bacterium]
MYSIYQKMSQKHKTLEEVYDHFAMRVIVPTVKDCYHTLGLVHQYFYPLDHRFKDFIATPKANGYRSIHTTIDIE